MNEHTHVVGTRYLYSIFTPLSPNSEENQQNFDQTLSNLKFTKACTYPNQQTLKSGIRAAIYKRIYDL